MNYRMKKFLKHLFIIIVSYTIATYIEAIALRIYFLFNGGVGAVFNSKAIMGLLMSPVLFPVRYIPILYIRNYEGLNFVFGLYFAPFMTFVAAFVVSYLVIMNRARHTEQRINVV